MDDLPLLPVLEAPLAWNFETGDVPANGLEIRKTATDAERAAVAEALGLLSCDTLEATYRVRRLAGDRYGLKGTLKADVVQACVITLAPVLETVSAPFHVEFRPPEEAAAAGGVVDLEDDTDIEAIEGGSLAVGRVVFEELAAALNPYPRRPGAEYAPPQSAGEGAAAARNNPFAVLAKLKMGDKPPDA
jgi:uncharacterized metal-binding protein YceD (DUF177 family)